MVALPENAYAAYVTGLRNSLVEFGPAGSNASDLRDFAFETQTNTDTIAHIQILQVHTKRIQSIYYITYIYAWFNTRGL